MSRPPLWPRRRILQGVLLPVLLRYGPASAQSSTDRGIGGTGAVPSKPEETGQDRGIGGTGVIGTIRQFGSIVVNDLRITFPRSVAVRIDDRTARLQDLKLGHVVHVLARQSGAHFKTDAISVVSEVVGPIEAMTHHDMTILGQTIMRDQRRAFAPRWKVGDVVAVSGLRRLDGVIVASLIERRPPGTVQIAGVANRNEKDGVKVGALSLIGLDPAMTGRRILASGRLSEGALVVERATAEPSLLAQNPARLLIEDYVARDKNGLRLGSGLPVDAGASLNDIRENTRAFLATEVQSDGRLRLQTVQANAGLEHSHHAASNAQPGPGHRLGRPKGLDPSPSRSGAGRPPRERSGPGSSGRPSRG